MHGFCRTSSLPMVLLTASAVITPGAEFYVSPAGDDAQVGTRREPFATIERAQHAVRDAAAGGLDADITVHLAPGHYQLTRPLQFTAADGGTETFAVRYRFSGPGRAVVSGGRRITGWQRGADGAWTAGLPEVASGAWRFRQLFVDGARAVRARTPNTDEEEYCFRLRGAELRQDLSRFELHLDPEHVAAWRGLDAIEAVVLKNWSTLRKRVASVHPETGTVVLRPPHVRYFGGNRPRRNGGCFFENSRDFLDQPGEWYLDDGTGLLSYIPLPGQDMADAEVFAPVLPYLLSVTGTPEVPVRNLHIEGLTFVHSHLPLADTGHHGRQAAFRYGVDGVTGSMPCAIRWSHARDCRFTRCLVTHIGGSAVELRAGCMDCTVEGNEVADVEGNGINVWGPNDPDHVPRGNRILNNYVHHCGRIYYGACAIWAGFAQDTTIAHNLVCQHPYTGISIGWKWDAAPTVSRRYVIAFNHVHDVMNEVCDGGAIYSLGYHEGTVLRANHLHDVHRSRYAIAAPNNGIFMDQGSKGYLIEDNVIYRTSGAPVRHNQNRPEWHTWRNNRFIRDDRPTEPRAVQGKVGKGMLCGYLDVGHASELDPVQFTLSAWVKLTSISGGRQWIVNKNDDEWTDGHIALVVINGAAGAYLNIGGTRANRFTLVAEERLAPNQWYHLAATYDGADWRLYVNGGLAASQVIDRPRRPGRQPLTIGRRQDGFAGSTVCGVVDEVRLHAAALSAPAIRRMYVDTGSEVAPDVLAEHWTFEDLPPAPDTDHDPGAALGAAEAAGLEPQWQWLTDRGSAGPITAPGD